MGRLSVTDYQPFRLTKLGARLAVTAMFAYLGSVLIGYYVPASAKEVVFVAAIPVLGLLYWRFWTWVMSLRRKR